MQPSCRASSRRGSSPRLLAGISSELGMKAEALLTDMNQPLGDWAGHACEVREVLDCLAGAGAAETVELTLALALALGRQIGAGWSEASLRGLLASGAARERLRALGGRAGRDGELVRSPRSPAGAGRGRDPGAASRLRGRGADPAARPAARRGRGCAALHRLADSTSASRSTTAPGWVGRWRRARSWRGSICASPTRDLAERFAGCFEIGERSRHRR